MANYSLVIGSKFRPFEYQEMLAPVLLATQAHQQLEESYADLATKSNIWDGLTEGSDKAHATYQAYAKALEDEASRLATEGLNPASRRAMLNMRSRYARDITPIEAAYKRREEQIAEQRKLGTKMIYDFDAATTSLDKYLDNPSLSYNSIDRSDLYSRAVTDFGQYAKALADYGNGNRLDEFTKTFIQNYGISKDEARKFITDMRMGRIDEANPTLRAIYDALYNSTGVQNWDSRVAQDRVRETILEGVGAAIGKPTISTYEDKGAVMARQLANSKALARYQQELANQAAEAQRMKMYDVSPTTLYSKSEISEHNRRLARELDTWKGKGYFDDQGNLTAAGREAITYKTRSLPTYRSYTTSAGASFIVQSGTKNVLGYGDRDFYNWASKNANLVDAVTGGGDIVDAHATSISRFYQNARAGIDSGTLPMGSANFQVYRQRLRNKEDRELVADNITSVLGGDGKIYTAGMLKQGRISEGTPVSASQFRDKVSTNPILYIINSPTTGLNGQQLVELTNGEKYLLPPGIIGDDTQADLDAANRAVRNSGSVAETVTNLNRANTYVASILTSTTGTEIKPNDGTVTISIGE